MSQRIDPKHRMNMHGFAIRQDQIDFLDSLPTGTKSSFVREAIDKAIKRSWATKR